MRCIRHARLLVLAAVVSPALACGSKLPLPANPRELVKLLESPDRRDRAACRLLELQRYRVKPRYTEEVCTSIEGEVNHVVLAPQADGTSIYIVFRNPRYPSEVAGPGRPKGPFTLIDSEGYLVPVFGAANVLDAEDAVFAYDGTGQLAVAHVIREGGGENSSRWTAVALHVVPVRPAQRSVLTVVLGPPILPSDPVCAGAYWNWRLRDLDADGIPEIEVGPRQNDVGDILPRAVYRWSKSEQRYEGPVGSVESGYIRLDSTPAEGGCCPYGSAIERFVTERRKLPVPGDPSAVRKNDCGKGITFTQ
jgi:hypothetical protein